MIVLIATTLGGGDSGDGDARSSGNGSGSAGAAQGGQGKPTPKTYEVQSGDTLNAISGKTGVPVGRIERLNPGVDPQILIAGERLKLR